MSGKKCITINLRKPGRRGLQEIKALSDETHIEHWRPRTRRECFLVPRPCPYVGCKFNLFLDVSATGESLIFNFPGFEPCEMGESCVLDIADSGGRTLDYIAQLVGVTKERVRQMEAEALVRLKQSIQSNSETSEMENDLH